MNLFSNKSKDVPEIGQEDLKEELEEGDIVEDFVYRSKGDSKKKGKSNKKKRSSFYESSNLHLKSGEGNDVLMDLKLEKIETRIESLQNYIKDFSERFSVVNQQIGELRSSSLSNERNLAKVSMDSEKAIDLVSDVQPEKLRIDYQRLEGRIGNVDEKIELQKEMVSGVLKEFEDFKRKSQVFIGTEGLLKLNSDIQKDLIQVQKLSSFVKLNADKSQNIFSELSKSFSEFQKQNELMNLFEKNYSGLRKEIESLKLLSNNFLSKDDLNKMKSTIEAKFEEILTVYEGYNRMINYNQNLGKLVQKLFLLNESNEEQLKEFSSKVNPNKLDILEKKVESLLDLLDKLSSEIMDLKKSKVEGIKNNSVGDVEKEKI